MKRFLYTLLLSYCAASVLVSCTNDPTQDLQPSNAEGETWVTLDFCDNSFDEINITTRATLSGSAESRVSNLFIFIFDASGKRVCGRFFDPSNRVNSVYKLKDSKVDCWVVSNNADETAKTTGKVRMYAPKVSDGTLYILANVNADMVNISPDKLRFVETLDDLNAMTATLNQRITERNGFFPMTGSAPHITINDVGTISSSDADVFPVKLTRIDAKITVKVQAAEGYESTMTDESGNITTHKIKEFVPLSWQVVNLPRATYVLPRPDEDAQSELFNSHETKFETRTSDGSITYKDLEGKDVTKTVDVHGFSFYMLENRPKLEAGKTSPTGYHQRDKRKKNADRTYTSNERGGDVWEFAPAEATYLIIKGEVIMDLNENANNTDQQLNAEVVYYIHLGDFRAKIGDFNINRNNSYTYTITIKGVDNVQVEVEKDVENESGATGHVYVAKESILTFDAHYGRAVVVFDEKFLTKPDELSWYVKTPFGREGSPTLINGIEVPSGLDYKWVHFMINDHDNNKYSDKHMKYDHDKAMDILKFSEYIKNQGKLFKAGKPNDFRNHDGHNIIYVTIFVDEFYYTSDPVTGDVRQDLWKDFVNQPNRMLHILCDSRVSKDEESRATGSVVTIRQRSIQTVFNTEKPDLKTAWGCETVDETRDVLWYYSRNESYDKNGNWVKPADVPNIPIPSYDGNVSPDNGLYNTARIWGLTSTGSYTPKRWDEFIDFEQPYTLKDEDDKETLRCSCLARNRDENGNEVIDAAEVKWYMASINQLASLYVGDQGLNADAVMYPYYKQKIKTNDKDANNAYAWRSHIVSSTAYMTDPTSTGGYPEIMWAEEGLSTGPYTESYGKSAGLSVRCVRNLGMDPVSEDDARQMLLDTTRIPEKAIKVEGPGLGDKKNETVSESSVYTFDLTNLNPLSVRYYSSQELEPNDEFSMEARTYWMFETGILTSETYTYDELYKLLREGNSPCPDGYHVPNVREGALMTLRCPGAEVDWKWQAKGTYSRVSTYYSHGNKYGTGLDTEGSSWLFDPDRTRLDDGGHHRIRCVKDIRQ